MTRRRSKLTEPDLFALAQPLPVPAPEPAPVSLVTLPAAEPVVAVPVHTPSLDDIAAALPSWSDADLSRLRDMLDTEWQSRGLTGAAAAPAPQRSTTVRQRKPEALAEGLTAAQLKLIRSAAKAGVSARDIARQFGLPPAAVEHVLEARRR